MNLHPEGTLTLDSDLLLGPSTTLQFNITSLSHYDRLTSIHQLGFDGTLSVSLDPSYTPSAGDSFDLLDFSSNLFNIQFSTLSLPYLPGLTWDTSNLYTTGTLPEPSLTFLLILPALTLSRRRRTTLA